MQNMSTNRAENLSPLPCQIFYSTQVPGCLWSLAKNKAANAKRNFRERHKQALFIDAHFRHHFEHKIVA